MAFCFEEDVGLFSLFIPLNTTKIKDVKYKTNAILKGGEKLEQ